jgi:peptidoglycan DL-endopeptidase CwlO
VIALIAGAVFCPARSAVAGDLSSTRAQAAQIAAQIQAQGEQLAVFSEQYDQAQIRVQQLDQQLTLTRVQITQTRVRVTSARDDLRQQAIRDYTSDGSTTGLEQLFAPDGEQSSIVQEYQQVASGNAAAAIDRLNRTESVLNAQETALQTTESAARAALAASQSARQGAQAALANQQATLSRVTGQIATLVAQQQAAEAAAQAAAFQARVAAQRTASNGPQPSVSNGPQPSVSNGPQPSVSNGPPPSVSNGPQPSASNDPGASRPPPSAPGEAGAQAVAAAETQIGVPYVWGGSTPGVGFDCSGLTMWAWGRAGVTLPHSAADQYGETEHVPLSDLQPGDLLFYDEGGIIGHVTMYVGPGQMIQAMETGTRIQITGIWTSGLVGAGRP